MAANWESSNGATVPSDMKSSFTLEAPPETDIWRPSKDKNVFDAPSITTSIPMSSFKRVQVTFSANWKTQFDQGGLLLTFPGSSSAEKAEQWVKAGIERFEGQNYLGVVGCDRFSDWSVCPINESKATIEMVRTETTLWIYLLRSDGSRQPLRENKWAFLGLAEAEGKQQSMRVGVYVAKPTPDSDDKKAPVKVEFENLQLETDG